MIHATHPLRGPLFMVLATGSYIVNDTMMKLATDGLPPYQVLTMRGLAGLFWGLPLLLLLGYGRRAALLFNGRVVLRNVLEACAVLCFIVALANMPISDAIALGQVTPLIVLLGASFLFGDRVPGIALALIGVGFVGAIMVAQPTGAGISVYALLALANAVLAAARDLAGRRIGAEVPGMIVSISAIIVVAVGAGALHLVAEEWVVPSARHVLLLAGSGFFLIFGHLFIFLAYRVGPTSAVAPFYYCFTVWAVISGLVVFGHVPNALALAGMALVIASGTMIVLLDQRKRRPAPVS